MGAGSKMPLCVVVIFERRLMVATLCSVPLETAWAHLPVSVEPCSDDGLVDVGWTPVQVCIYPIRPFQAFSGTADVYGIAADLVSLRQR